MDSVVKRQNRKSDKRGFTLLELVIASLVLGVVSVGALGYQYHARRMAMRARAEITAARTARLILDNWKRTGGDENFNLTSLQMGFVKNPNNDTYALTVDDQMLTVSLDWQDIEVDTAAMVTLRHIEAIIRWRSDYQTGAIRESDPIYRIHTYVRKEEAGG